MPVTRIIAVRHGETAWNVDTRIQGHLDIPLNEQGLRQAAHLAQALAQGDTIDAIYASDLSRAHATASAIGQALGQGVTAHIGLRERHFGEFQGRTFKDIEVELPDHAWHWRKRTPDWIPPSGGESLVMLRERILNTVNELAAAHSGQQIVLVAHGGVLDIAAGSGNAAIPAVDSRRRVMAHLGHELCLLHRGRALHHRDGSGRDGARRSRCRRGRRRSPGP